MLFDFLYEAPARYFLLLGRGPLRLAGLRRELVDAGDDLLDRRMRAFERFHHLRLGHFLRTRLDHHDAVLAAGDDEVERAAPALFEGRIDHEVAVDMADAHTRDRPRLRNAGQRERRRRPGDREHVGVVLGIRGDHEGDDLRLVAPSGREQRPDRPIDQAAREHFLFGRLAFALEESAGDPAGGVGVLLVVAVSGRKSTPSRGLGSRAGGDENHGVAGPDDDRSIRLLGQPAGFDRDGLAANIDFACVHVNLSLSELRQLLECASRVTGPRRAPGGDMVVSNAPCTGVGVTCGCPAA